MRPIIFAAALALSGCGVITNALAPDYEPVPIRVYLPSQYASDVAECSAAGKSYTPKFSLGGALAKTIDGATSNSSMIPLSPLVPAYGAAGGAAKAASDGFDVASETHANVYRNCLHDETQIDKSAVLADPRP